MLDFRNQNLRGRSFRNQDLTDADFSGADVRGADFSSTNIINAKFCQSKMGKTKSRSFLLLWLSLPVSVASYFFTYFSSSLHASFYLTFSSPFLKYDHLDTSWCLIFVGPIFFPNLFISVLFFSVSLWHSLKNQNWQILWIYFCGFVAFIVLIGKVSISFAGAVAVAFLITGIGSLLVVTASVLAGTGGMIIAIMFTFVGLAKGVIGVLIGGKELIEGIGAAWITILYLSFFGQYLIFRCLKYEEPLFLPLRRLTIKFKCWGGTNFDRANLVETRFNESNLKHARFTCSNKIIRCNFQNAKNLHLANTLNTTLEPLAVRQLMLTSKTDIKDFSNFNLRGVTFEGLDLRGCNFHHADLSEADFRGCNLEDCDFSEAMALGTLFDNAIFTGAILDNWSIDKTTQFTGAHSRFVYLKRDQSERNPPQGEFKDDDFAKLYQEIANTVDFIAHNSAELQALLRAIEKIKADGDDIFIQQMERKADSVVLRVQSECIVELDKAAIYFKVQQQKEIEILAIRQEYEQKLLIQQNELEKERIKREAKAEQVDLLAGLLNKAIDKPVIANTGNIGEISMNDNSRSISNATIQNSAVSLGDNSTVTNSIQQLPDSQDELKDVLMQLVALLEKSQVADIDKQKVEQEIKNLTYIATKSSEERKNLGSKIFTTLKDLTTIFKELPEIGLKYGELLAKLWLLI